MLLLQHFFDTSIILVYKLIMTNWKKNPSKDIKNLKELLDDKYGKKEFNMNLRNVCLADFKKIIKEFNQNFSKVLLVGANNFEEVDLLPSFNYLIGVDLAYTSFKSIKSKRENIIPIVANAEILPFIDNHFDQYCAFRTLFSDHTNLFKCLSEADRVTKDNGQLIISIPNGYLLNKKIIKGMYEYNSSSYNQDKPYEYAKKVISYFEEKNYLVKVKEVTSEIIILIQK